MRFLLIFGMIFTCFSHTCSNNVFAYFFLGRFFKRMHTFKTRDLQKTLFFSSKNAILEEPPLQTTYEKMHFLGWNRTLFFAYNLCFLKLFRHRVRVRRKLACQHLALRVGVDPGRRLGSFALKQKQPPPTPPSQDSHQTLPHWLPGRWLGPWR